MTSRTSRRVASDGVELAVWEQGPSDAPSVLLVHGFPDTHEVWSGVADALAKRFHVVMYDVRGAGGSSAPAVARGDAAYRLDALSRDLVAVARACGRGRPVHVVGHDWGAIQAWEPLSDRALEGVFSSFTSISGPCLDHVGHWMRNAPTSQRVRQAMSSWYIGAFHLPGIGAYLPTALRALGRRLSVPIESASPTLADDARHGTALYRANIAKRLISPRNRRVHVPVQIVIPRADRFVTRALADAAVPWVDELYQREIPGDHWVIRHDPSGVAQAITDLIDQVTRGTHAEHSSHAESTDHAGHAGHAGHAELAGGTASSAPPVIQPLRNRRVEQARRPVPRPRKYRANLENIPLEWIPGDRQTTHTIDVLSLLLPEGEAWFVEVFRDALPLLEGHPSLPEVRGFMGQEAIHGRTHLAVLEHLASHGINTDRYCDSVRWIFRRPGARAPFGVVLPPAIERVWIVERVGIIAAIEQLTSMLGDWVLTQDALERAGADPRMLDLLHWHGAEEVEHRTVAHDAHVALGGGHAGRALGMIIVAPTLIFLWHRGTTMLIRKAHTATGQGNPTARWSEFFRAGREGLLPTIGTLTSAVTRYFLPSHDPIDEGHDELAERYFASSERFVRTPIPVDAARACP